MIFLFDRKLGEVRALTHCEVEGLCFLITIRCLHTGQKNRAAIVNCAYELRLYLEVAKDVDILKVQMMCPPAISGLSEWVLEEVESIVIYSSLDRSESAVVYRTKSKTYKLGELDLRKRKSSHTLYSGRELLDRVSEKSEVEVSRTEPFVYSKF